MIRKTVLIFPFLVISLAAHAQIMPQPAGADSVQNAFFPIVGYSSDDGFLGGAVYNRYDYSGNKYPFKTYLQTAALISTKGFIKAEGVYEQTDAFGSGFRSRTHLFFERRKNNTFFGIGNNTTYSEQLWDNDFYFFESVGFGLDLELRRALYIKGMTHFDAIAGIGTEYQNPMERQPNSSFSQVMPNGSEGGFVNYITTGFVWENRDREFDPGSGNRAQLDVKFAPALFSEYALTTLKLDLRQYFYVFDFLKIANRLQLEHADGNVPFWELPALGDDYTLRGYPLNRFRGNSFVSYNLELRSWMFTFPEYRFKLGVHVFTDAGRVFTGQDEANDLFEGYKQTFGFGGAMSLFSPDFILRGEVGFSEDTSRIYVGIGYTF